MLNYKYYDTPEGTDIFKKTFVTSKYAALGGLSMATLDVLMYSHPKGIINTVGRYGWYLGPLIGMASAFTVTTNVAQNIRGKNDKLNYFLGGAAAGSIFGAWSKSITGAVPVAIVLGFAAVVKKMSIDEGWVLMPDWPQATKTIGSVRHDWTLVKDVEDRENWITGSKFTVTK